MTKAPLHLTEEQSAIVASLSNPGFVLMGRITREQYDGTNADSSGAYVLEIGAVKESALPLMRAAILEANNPAKTKRKKAQTKTHRLDE